MAERIQEIKKLTGINKIAQVSSACKLLSDPTRLKILCLLFENRMGLCVNEIAEHVGISHSAASHQLTKLEARNIVTSFREGQMICYAISDNNETRNLEKVISIFRRT